MKKLLPLLLCFSLSFFTVARATKPAHTPAAGAKSVQKPIVQAADQKIVAAEEETDEEGTSEDEGEDASDDGSGAGDTTDQAISDNDEGNDDLSDDTGDEDSVGDEPD